MTRMTRTNKCKCQQEDGIIAIPQSSNGGTEWDARHGTKAACQVSGAQLQTERPILPRDGSGSAGLRGAMA